jgi:guanylate cyclase soluble subunit beta
MAEEHNMRLFRAAARGSLEHAWLALKCGADINARDYNDQTAIDIALSRKHLDLVDNLISLGAEPASTVDSTRTASACLDMRHRHAKHTLATNFPSSVASAMMRNQQVAVVSKPCVSIAFLEIAGYSALRSSSDPVALCSLLARLWDTLDALAAHHGVERIDAFDGCYMTASNYSAQQPADHAVRLARFATAAIAAAAAFAVNPLGPVRLLGGMHCGAVCGRVVGAHGGRKHTLHGDAVNVASRMQSHGAAGAVHCSAAAAALIEQQGAGGLRVTPRGGSMEVKSLGRVCTSWVSRRAGPSESPAGACFCTGDWAEPWPDARPGGPPASDGAGSEPAGVRGRGGAWACGAALISQVSFLRN